MPRQYIDPQPFKDRIAALEQENAELKAQLDAAKAGETVPGEADLKAKLEAAEAAIGAANVSLNLSDSQVGITEPKSPSETASE